ERDPWIGLPEMQARRDLFMLERERGLDEARDPGGGFQMPDVAFDRADETGLPILTADRERRPERLRFNQVAQSCSGSVSLHILNFSRQDAGISIGFSQ